MKLEMDSLPVQKDATQKDHLDRVTRVLNHIQENLGEKLRLDDLARVACFSPFHFHRIFQAYLGETLNEYVRRVRLERAAYRLCRTADPVTDVALDYGYETPSAFNKAFLRHFGESPSGFRSKNRAVILPAAKLIIRNLEDIVMEPRIVEREETPVVYVRRTGKYSESAEAAWGALGAYAGPRGLFQAPGAECIGVSHDDPDTVEAEKLRYDACVTAPANTQPEGEVQVQTLAGGKYAVFLHEGPYENLVHTYRTIYGQWVPASGKELRELPCFEVYLNSPDQTPPEDLRTDICIPIA